jgi:hypothetical protein
MRSSTIPVLFFAAERLRLSTKEAATSARKTSGAQTSCRTELDLSWTGHLLGLAQNFSLDFQNA